MESREKQLGRLLNRRQQGDLGEASAIEWLTSKGAAVLIPFGHSPHFDLAAEIEGRLLRIQVKTSTRVSPTPAGHERLQVSLKTCGGNQSWSGVSKKIDPSRFDFLFVLTARGRRWFIPSVAIDGLTSIDLGGPKHAQYEIEPGSPLREIVLSEGAPIHSEASQGEYRSGQPGGAVNAVAQSFAGSNPASPIASPTPVKPTNYERRPGRRGEAVINQKRRITIPQRPFFDAGFQNGSRVRARSLGPGRILLEQIELPAWARNGAEGDLGSSGDQLQSSRA